MSAQLWQPVFSQARPRPKDLSTKLRAVRIDPQQQTNEQGPNSANQIFIATRVETK